ncbi:unnamed protein product, partial [Urochloa humidicola]
ILLHSSLSSPHQNQQSSPFSLTCPLQNPAVRHGAVDPSPHRAGRTPAAQIRRKPALGRGAACGASPRSAVMEQPDAPRPSHICSCFSVVAGDTALLCIAMNVIPTSLSCSGISSLTALLFLSRTTARRKPLFSAAPSICSAVQQSHLQNPIADEEASCITDPLDKVQQMTQALNNVAAHHHAYAHMSDIMTETSDETSTNDLYIPIPCSITISLVNHASNVLEMLLPHDYMYLLFILRGVCMYCKQL